jgi:hypothetical protein
MTMTVHNFVGFFLHFENSDHYIDPSSDPCHLFSPWLDQIFLDVSTLEFFQILWHGHDCFVLPATPKKNKH